jgi:hypothetical protein
LETNTNQGACIPLKTPISDVRRDVLQHVGTPGTEAAPLCMVRALQKSHKKEEQAEEPRAPKETTGMDKTGKKENRKLNV